MYCEFLVGKDLLHPNIVKYHYFMREYFPKKKKHEFHIIMERIKGGDMEDRIRKYGCAKKIETIKEIGG